MGECLGCLCDDFFKEVVDVTLESPGLGGGEHVTYLNVFVLVVHVFAAKSHGDLEFVD